MAGLAARWFCVPAFRAISHHLRWPKNAALGRGHGGQRELEEAGKSAVSIFLDPFRARCLLIAKESC